MSSLSPVLTQTLPSGRQAVINSLSVSGGTLYMASVEGLPSQPETPSLAFVPSAVPSPLRYLRLTDAKSDAGVALTATAGSGSMGVARTAGTSLQLTGEATSASAKTDVALWEFDLPDSYVVGANVPVLLNAVVTGSGTLTAPSTTLTVAAYTEVNGVETALTVSAAQTFGKTAATLTFTVTGTGLVSGQHMAIEVTMVVTSASGANTGWLNSIAFQA